MAEQEVLNNLKNARNFLLSQTWIDVLLVFSLIGRRDKFSREVFYGSYFHPGTSIKEDRTMLDVSLICP